VLQYSVMGAGGKASCRDTGGTNNPFYGRHPGPEAGNSLNGGSPADGHIFEGWRRGRGKEHKTDGNILLSVVTFFLSSPRKMISLLL